MEHIKLKPGKHLILISVNKEVPAGLLEKVTNQMHKMAPELATVVLQADVTVLSLEEEQPASVNLLDYVR